MPNIRTKIITPRSWPQQAKEVANAVMQGALAVFPTETVYGISAHPDQPRAIERIYELKNRHLDKPLQLLISDIDIVARFVRAIPLAALRLMKAFWPGPLTVVFPFEDTTVGLRMPDHPVALKLISLCGGVLYATSANISGMPDAVDFESARDVFDGKVEYIIDGGACEKGKPSTVVACNAEQIDVLREGFIQKEEIMKFKY